MRVLWITNILFPDINTYLGGAYNPSGGWMLSLAESIKSTNEVQLAIASVTPLCDKLIIYNYNQICYYAIPLGKGNLSYNEEYTSYWYSIENDFKPDIVHIHGTEFTHGLSYVETFGVDKVVVSIQGLLTEIAKYSQGGLTNTDIIKNITIRDLVSRTDLKSESRRYRSRAIWERLLLSKARYVIGRTKWDKENILKINPELKYFSVNESMRDVFYGDVWNVATCRRHSIFLSQASCALKGAHFVFKALPEILKKFPDTIVRIAGNDIITINSIKDVLKQTNYSKYLRKLIKGLKLENCIHFLGVLDADEMKREYLNANLFICSSSIENSPNSIGEAQLLGVPILAARVGGVPSIVESSILYEYDDVKLLASRIMEIFSNSDTIDNTQTRRSASVNYDRTLNVSALLNVYNSILYDKL